MISTVTANCSPSQTYNLPEEHVAAYLKSHAVNTIVGKLKHKGELKEHPDVQKFLEWKDKLKVTWHIDWHAWGYGRNARG